jgi:DNA helicase-2/ATP-dependent DNA helicase PcrA
VPDGGPLASFLAHASLEAGEHQAGEGEEAVQLMTVHAAKGLEFDVVFITGLEQGLFPHENAAQERDGLEEERRLMYVAVTRARHRLYLSHAQTRLLHGQTRYCLPSAFLDELPAELLRKINRGATVARPPAAVSGQGWPRPAAPAVCGSARTCAMPGSASGSSCPPKVPGRKRACRSISAPAA